MKHLQVAHQCLSFGADSWRPLGVNSCPVGVKAFWQQWTNVGHLKSSTVHLFVLRISIEVHQIKMETGRKTSDICMDTFFLVQIPNISSQKKDKHWGISCCPSLDHQIFLVQKPSFDRADPAHDITHVFFSSRENEEIAGKLMFIPPLPKKLGF